MRIKPASSTTKESVTAPKGNLNRGGELQVQTKAESAEQQRMAEQLATALQDEVGKRQQAEQEVDAKVCEPISVQYQCSTDSCAIVFIQRQRLFDRCKHNCKS